MSAPANSERLQRLLGRDDLRWLVDALRRRLERGGGERLSISSLESSQRAAAEALFGRRAGSGRSFSFRLSELELILRQSGAAADLRSAIEQLSGPLVDRRAEQARVDAEWEAVFACAGNWARERGLEPWLDELRGDGLLKRLSGGDPEVAGRLLEEVRRVVACLPSPGESLSTLAARTVGDAHGLDPGRPLAALVRRAVRQMTGRVRIPHPASATEGGNKSGLAEEPDDPRALWALVGVFVGGGLTSTVLVLNLPADGKGATGRSLVLQREAGEPLWLTLRQLLRQPPGWHAAGVPVYVCENPAVVAEAADSLGPRCPPLVCTYGRPTAAVTALLDALAAAGAELHYHGDFDWPGIAIANTLIDRYHAHARPWRYGAADYRQGIAGGELPLTGQPVAARWDPDLSDAMFKAGVAVHEEAMMPLLLRDLAE